jgi:hypothetical protein
MMMLLSLALLLAACTAPNLAPGSANATAVPGAGAVTSAPPAVTPTAESATSTSPVSTPSGQPGITAVTLVPATSQPAGAGTQTPQPVSTSTGTPAAGAPAGSADQGLNVTLADDSKTITLKVGQRFLLDLGSDLDWTPTVANPAIVSRVIGITVIRGAQGVYEALAPGTTTLSANGSPACRQTKPACAMPNRLFQVTIVVQP